MPKGSKRPYTSPMKAAAALSKKMGAAYKPAKGGVSYPASSPSMTQEDIRREAKMLGGKKKK